LYSLAILNVLRPFGNLVAIWYLFPPFWYIVSRKIWQPCRIVFATQPLSRGANAANATKNWSYSRDAGPTMFTSLFTKKLIKLKPPFCGTHVNAFPDNGHSAVCRFSADKGENSKLTVFIRNRYNKICSLGLLVNISRGTAVITYTPDSDL
jgi:hypothetical protein